MFLELFRKESNGDATVGELYVDGEFECMTLEDEARTVKVMHETRIPAGEYKILLQQDGEMTKKYAKKFLSTHKGMLWLQDVPGFSSIYIHIGNTDEDTSGCILVGRGFDKAKFKLTESTIAYVSLYSKVVAAVSKREVTIKIFNETA